MEPKSSQIRPNKTQWNQNPAKSDQIRPNGTDKNQHREEITPKTNCELQEAYQKERNESETSPVGCFSVNVATSFDLQHLAVVLQSCRIESSIFLVEE
jgi:hypothetical protein